MELFYTNINKVLTLPELLNFQELHMSVSGDDQVSEFTDYLQFLSSIPKLRHFIKCFDNLPFDEIKALDSLKSHYPKDINRARKDMGSLNQRALSCIKFKGWKVYAHHGTECQITNDTDILLFDSYEGKNPYVLYNGVEVKSYQHLVEYLGLDLIYK